MSSNPYIQCYKTAQNAPRGADKAQNLNNTVEEYIGRVEDKYNRLGKGKDFNAGHQKTIAQTGRSFRKQTGCPQYDQQDPDPSRR